MKKQKYLLVVIDASTQLDKYDEEILIKVNLKKAIICFNKIDIANVIKKNDFKERFGENIIVEISAKKGIGIKELESKIIKKISSENDFDIDNKIIINIRHKKILVEVIKLLKEFY